MNELFEIKNNLVKLELSIKEVGDSLWPFFVRRENQTKWINY